MKLKCNHHGKWRWGISPAAGLRSGSASNITHPGCEMLQRVVTCRLSRILPATVRLPEPLGSSHAIDANLFKFQTEALPKFGVFVTIASQRPNDISPTITSQAHNYFIHRLLNEWDLKAIASAELEKIEWAIPLFPIKGIYGEANQSRIRARWCFDGRAFGFVMSSAFSPTPCATATLSSARKRTENSSRFWFLRS